MRSKYISWPQRNTLAKLSQEWQTKAGFPGVVGAIDGTYIQIPGPQDESRDAYICRKGFTAMHSQVVCDRSLKFMDVHTGNTGSVHDSRAFRNSDLKALLCSEDGCLPPQYHLIGDSAYPLSAYLLVPFKDNGHLGEIEKKYNLAHSKTRVTVEHAIGLLKGKFRRLKYLDMVKRDEIPYVIFAACVLHNLILQESSLDEDEIDFSEIEGFEAGNVCEDQDSYGRQKRLAIAQALF